MFVDTLSCNELKADFNWSKVTEKPDLEDIESAILRLDGAKRTIVSLSSSCPDLNAQLTILGGGGRYLVMALLHADKVYGLHPPSLPSHLGTTPSRHITVGWCRHSLPEDLLVDLEVALQVARTFAQYGILEPSYRWSAQ